jgi:germination protein M
VRRLKWILIFLVIAAGIGGYFYYKDRQEGDLAPGFRTDTVAPVQHVQQIDLYFADSSGSRLALERREVAGATMPELVDAVVEELIGGPDDDSRSPVLPPSARVRSTFFRDGVAYVDFTDGVREGHPGGAWTEVLTVYAIVNTLTENFAEIEFVQIMIEGREADTLAGHVDISVPLRGRVQLLSGDWQ